MKEAKVMMKHSPRNCAVVLLLAGLLAACGDREVAEPDPTVSPTSIIREGFEEPVPKALALAPLEVRLPFPEGGAELGETAIAELETLLDSPQMDRNGSIVLRGHSDAAGSDEVNLRASEERARAVMDWLVERGVAPDRITLIAFGEQNPIEPNAKPDGTPHEAGRALNRRVDVHVGIEARRKETIAEQFDEQMVTDDEATAEAQQD